jgi:hypothetical protein
MGTIISAIIDGLIGAALKYLQALQQRRDDVAKGRAEQHTADVEATVSEAKDAAKIKENVAAESDAAVDADLERLRHNASPTAGH